MVSRDVLESLANIGISEGRAFITANQFNDVDKDIDDDRNFIIENPSDSGVYVAVSAPNVTTDTTFEVQPYKNVTVDTPGTSATVVNTRTDGTDTPVCNPSYEVGFSGGTPFPLEQSPGSGFQSIASLTENRAVLISPGDNYLIEATNIGPSASDLTIEMPFAETLEKNIPAAWSP